MEHHVYFWLKDERQNDADRREFEDALAALFEIDTVAGGIWATPAATPERPVTEQSWDYALSMRFETIAQHDSYQEDPDHDVFIDRFKDWWEKVQVRDLAEGA